MFIKKIFGLNLKQLLTCDHVIKVLDRGNPLFELGVLSDGNFDTLAFCVELYSRDLTIDEQVIACELLTAEVILVLQLMVEQGQNALIELINFS